MTSTSPVRRLLQFPLTWLVIGTVTVGGAYALITALTAATGDVGAAVLPLAGAVVAMLLYHVVMRRIARRATPETAAKGALFDVLLGIEIGLGFIAVSVATITLLGGYRIEWASADVLGVVLQIVALNVGVAVVEELIFRGFALQALERLTGSWFALGATALFFGAAHLANPGATLWRGLAIAIEAGVLLGAVFLWRRSLWTAIGAHFAWNTTVGLLGIPVSGHALPGLFNTTATGSPMLTGGEFGLEASIVPVVVSLLLSIPMLVIAHRRGNLVSRPRRNDPSVLDVSVATTQR
ncbi:CPBP family intramembrane glutamic endopeptidase [Paramicrobacterium agarici]|uniref:CAAX prenyl protease 2/Lysostaphin resistance protein A-like domain-containing protein n=1 Tax=Paramicrobacterium agarici TaxID=630514 RepID=A0A2A9DZG4_9MICO|nr:type II CAAX endopeptidase family protein [Microbacterium agarici]PFG31994.1 hypothetical protein ATJ78_2977 [Microbacterium agarici]